MAKVRFVEIGEVIEHGGKTVRCVSDGNEYSFEICDKCVFQLGSAYCLDLQCSRFTRPDKESVHFVEVEL